MILVAAVVLAAGEGRRMGAAKPLVTWRGRSLVAHAVGLAVAAGCDPVIVVQGAHPLPRSDVAPATVVTNAQWSRGPLSSLQTGLRALAGPGPVLVLTVDRPHVALESVEALLQAHRERPDAVWQPAYEGAHGHPIVYPADLVGALLALEPTDSARTLIGRPQVQARRRFVEVDDPAVVDNIDRPQDLQRIGGP